MNTFKDITSGLFTAIVVVATLGYLSGYLYFGCEAPQARAGTKLTFGWCAVYFIK